MEHKASMVNLTIEKDYDSEFCGSIPLHLVNLIQPHGMLLVLDKPKLHIVQASENVEQYLSIPVDELLEQSLSQYISTKQFEEIQQKITSQSSQDKIPINLTLSVKDKKVAVTALVHPREEYVLMELEENFSNPDDNSFIGLYQHIKYITSLLKQAGSTQETAQIAATEIKKFTGFDRVLVYQFDPQWNGIVIAQAKEEDMDDYMDLRFPASDVPKQARDLYFSNPYRLIPTRNYKPVRLIPVVNPMTNRFTDLSDSNLRSVAAVHLEYLGNLNIMASMSLPLIIDNKLWGLISCHHKTAKNPSYELRSAMELLSGIISAQVASKERENAILLKAQLRGLHAQLLEQLYNSPGFADGLLSGATDIQKLLSLSGAAVIYDGGIWTSGNTPGKQELKELAGWLRRNQADKLYVTSTLPKNYIYSKEYKNKASGLIALSINAEQGEYILGFRPEVLQTVNWGGNPNQAIQMESDGKTYHPRNSFATYQETVKHTSLPWLAEEVEAAEALRSAVLEKIIKERY
ncbi:GAF domain-containing protein [Pontibacter silvestris]|uniref:GAF domain-containing protein n=1 Tax=Pontibacter silvestris TaxID=2305183 RepID=A0ABW4WX55_9BACT|nr:GAF domain-containing protein [Pontibacter silvestris]MCC9138917.1 GAF domain-containing protein [Pontibacter silvestris]